MKELLICLSLAGCSGAWRDGAIRAANATATVANAGGQALLKAYCRESMEAIGRDGTWDGTHCKESGPRAGTAATPAEKTALHAVQAKWAPVQQIQHRVAQAYALVADLLKRTDAGAAKDLPSAVAALASAYGEMLQQSQAVSVPLSPVEVSHE